MTTKELRALERQLTSLGGDTLRIRGTMYLMAAEICERLDKIIALMEADVATPVLELEELDPS